jgi:hypothetical protein
LNFVDTLFHCAMIERDRGEADRVIAAIPPEGAAGSGNFVWPREWFVALAARRFNHPDTARESFTATRATLADVVRSQPDYEEAWSVLGCVDAALGRKEDAIQEARRACDLLPMSKDAWFGVRLVRRLAWTYAWVGEADLAIDQLAILKRDGGIHYGELRLNPEWDPLRGNERFEALVTSLAPPH